MSDFITALQHSLKAGVNLHCRFTVHFRTDVYRFLFGDKGHHAHKKEGRLFMLDDFCKEYFSGEWHRCYDRLRDGCEVDFPIRITSKLRWSTAVYDENCVHKPKCYTEILNVAVLKKRI